MDLSCVFFGVLFTLAGCLFACGKIHPHLAAWKAMSEEEKNKIKIKALIRNIGGVILLCGVLFLLKGFVAAFEGKWFVGAMIAWLILAGLDVWHISKSGRYKNE